MTSLLCHSLWPLNRPSTLHKTRHILNFEWLYQCIFFREIPAETLNQSGVGKVKAIRDLLPSPQSSLPELLHIIRHYLRFVVYSHGFMPFVHGPTLVNQHSQGGTRFCLIDMRTYYHELGRKFLRNYEATPSPVTHLP
jgi:hypothetical protein